jgi:flagella basal body P-ring formation protein FlgA
MTPVALFALAGCLALDSNTDRIVAGDLARAIPEFSAAAADATVGFAPAPGVQRVFRAAELRRLALSLGVPAAPEGDLCVERPVSILKPERLLAAMQKQLPEARIEILDYSRRPAPEGEIEFPLTGLRPAPGGAFWNGNIRYGENHSFAIWARVRALVTVERVVAVEDLKAGGRIQPKQVRLETRDEFPGGQDFAQAVDDVAGKVARIRVQAGTALRNSLLEEPKDVGKGDLVEVEARDGGAFLKFEAEAEAAGSVGDRIPVLNPVSKKRFWAQVSGKDKVLAGDPGALVNQ